MQYHRAALRRARVERRELRSHILVRQAMEAVAAHPLLVQRRGQREHLRDFRIAAMEGGVEACHLRQLRQPLQQEADGRQVVRLVQRRKRDVFLECGQNGAVEHDRLRVFEAAVHHAMTDTDESMVGEFRPDESDQMIERAFVAKLRALVPLPFPKHTSVDAFCGEARRRVQPLSLSARDKIQSIALRCVQRELEARRSGVEDGDRVHWFRTTPCCPLRAAPSRPALRPHTTRAASYWSRLGSSE